MAVAGKAAFDLTAGDVVDVLLRGLEPLPPSEQAEWLAAYATYVLERGSAQALERRAVEAIYRIVESQALCPDCFAALGGGTDRCPVCGWEADAE